MDVSGILGSMSCGRSKRDGQLPDELSSLNFCSGTGWDAVRVATRVVKREWKAAGLPVHTPTPKTVRKDCSHKSMSAIEARRGRNK